MPILARGITTSCSLCTQILVYRPHSHRLTFMLPSKTGCGCRAPSCRASSVVWTLGSIQLAHPVKVVLSSWLCADCVKCTSFSKVHQCSPNYNMPWTTLPTAMRPQLYCSCQRNRDLATTIEYLYTTALDRCDLICRAFHFWTPNFGMAWRTPHEYMQSRLLTVAASDLELWYHRRLRACILHDVHVHMHVHRIALRTLLAPSCQVRYDVDEAGVCISTREWEFRNTHDESTSESARAGWSLL